MAAVRRHGLYPELIEAALHTHRTRLPLRSEQHAHYTDLFVDHHQLQHLRALDWQVIFGRRGTGKTFLLGMLHEEAKQALHEHRTLSVMLTAQDFTASPVGVDLDDKLRGLGYFQQFIELLAKEVVDATERVLGEPQLLDVLTGRRKRAQDRIEELAIEVLEFAQNGQSVAAWDDVANVERREETADTSRTMHVAAESSISMGGPRGSLEAGGRAGVERLERRFSSRTVDKLRVPRFAAVRDRLKQLLSAMGIERLNILIDEWSTLDPTAAKSVQTEFAELLKRTFTGTPMFSVKIATNRYQTRFDNRSGGTKYRGLELGADIFEATNLDRVLRDPEELSDFYSKLLFRRLVHCEPALSVFDPHGTGAPDEQFILSIFKDRRAFMEMVYGAEGIPREFLEIFNTTAQSYRYRVRDLWDSNRIRECIYKISITDKQKSIEFRSEASQLLIYCIKPVVTTSGSRYFLMLREDHDALESAVDELLEKRLVHEFPRADLPANIRDKFEGFKLSYGVWLDWQRNLELEANGDHFHELLDRGHHQLLCIDTSKVNRSYMECAHCQAHFPVNVKAYQVRRLCPECFLPADGSSPHNEAA